MKAPVTSRMGTWDSLMVSLHLVAGHLITTHNSAIAIPHETYVYVDEEAPRAQASDQWRCTDDRWPVQPVHTARRHGVRLRAAAFRRGVLGQPARRTSL